MTKVSRYPIDHRLERKLDDNFWDSLAKIKRSETEDFFGRLLTPTEILMFAKRLEILKRLSKKESYSEIKMDLKVTNATVTKMSNILHRASREFLAALARLT